MKIKFYIVIFASLLCSCKNDENKKDKKQTNKIQIDSEKQVQSNLNSIEFHCGESKWIDEYSPQTELFAIFDSDTIKVADVNNCNNLKSERYTNFEIPNNAVSATYSFHAGYGEYFYATIEDRIGKIYKTGRNETSRKKYVYTLIGNYENGKYEPNRQTEQEEFLNQLQGSWKRQSYPYGTIEFKNNLVKFNTGEGNANIPQFVAFQLNRNCDTAKSNLNSETYDFWLITKDKTCSAINLTSNNLEIFFDVNASPVLYKKVDNQNDVDFSQDKKRSKRLLPLEPGFYVLEGSDCSNPSNSSWRYWNGIGLSGSSTSLCEMKLIDKDGNSFKVSQSCTNTYDKSKSTFEFTVKVSDVNSFTLIKKDQSQSFKFCHSTPSWLKT